MNTSKRGRKSSIQVPSTSDNLVLQTFHYNASDECAEILSIFATEHREDKNKQFKQAWQKWMEDPRINEILSNESRKLKEAGYEADPMEKMYFSARYYYRKKALKVIETNDTIHQAKPRKQYETADKKVLEQINKHIIEQIFQGCNPNSSPAQAFEHFCKTSANCIEGFNETKCKKIYKNRYFVLRKKCQEQ